MDSTIWTILIILSILPPLAYALYLRNREHVGREPVRAVLGAFVYGGTIGIAVAILLHVLFQFGYDQSGGPLDVPDVILAAVIIAPIVEELAKGFGLGTQKGQIKELEDGLIYGAALGLGFAATENLTYAVAALLDGGIGAALGTIAMRTVSSMLLHAGATGLLGYGYAKMVLNGDVVWSLIPYYMGAALLHATYNFLVSTEVGFGLAAAILMVGIIMNVLRRRIDALDALPHETWRNE